VSVRPAVFQRLHAFAQGGFSGDAGEWKRWDNEIIEILPSGERKVRFVPTSATDTPKTMEALCRNLAAQLPAVSPQLIKKVLAKLKEQGKIGLVGRGRGARWEVIP
jgi:hypothetical protein